MKTCGRCGKRKALSAFTINRSRKDGRNSSCKTCHKAYTRDHYAKNKDYYKDKAGKRNAAHRKLLMGIVKAAKSVPCPDCGGVFPYFVMDFDHVRGDKVEEVAVLVRRGVTEEVLRAEIAKCEAVCANCHRIRTYAEKFSPVAQLERAPVYETGSVGGSSPLGAAIISS